MTYRSKNDKNPYDECVTCHECGRVIHMADKSYSMRRHIRTRRNQGKVIYCSVRCAGMALSKHPATYKSRLTRRNRLKYEIKAKLATLLFTGGG